MFRDHIREKLRQCGLHFLKAKQEETMTALTHKICGQDQFGVKTLNPD
jgi:hypothetical protein